MKKTVYGFITGLAAFVLGAGFYACDTGMVERGLGNNAKSGDIAYTAVADGAAGTTDSSKIDFTFSEAVTGLTAAQIAVTADTGSAAKGSLSGSGKNWSLAIGEVAEGDVKVKISKTGIESGEKTVAVHKAPPPEPATWTVSADGAANTATSTAIAFTFDKAVAELTAEEIDLANGTGAVEKGALTGDGTGWSLAITVTGAGDITVTINKEGIESGPQTVTVHKAGEATPEPATWTVSTDGEAETSASTKIDFTFSEAVSGLTAAQITVTNGTGTVTKGKLTGSGTSWSLGITVITAGDVKVKINKSGVENTEKTVTAHKAPDTTPPANVTSLAGTPGDGQVVLSWNDPADADMASIEITWTPGGTTPQTVTKGTQAYTATGLTNGTAYTFTVKAVDTAENKNSGATIQKTPVAGAVPDTTPPANVTSLAGTPGDGQVTLSWTDPADDDLASIEITWTPGGTTVQTVAKGTQTYTATGLTNSTPYTFTVKAVDTAENKNTGATATATPAAGGGTPDTTAPANVTSLAGTPGDGQVTLSWNDPADGDLASVEITWTPDGTTAQTVNKGVETYTATGLTNSTPYTFTVKAVDTSGNRNTGATATATPAAPALDLTAAVTFGTDSGGGWVTGSSITGEGAAQTLELAVVEEPAAYFALLKEAGQTIEVSGNDEDRVTQLSNGEVLGDKTAGDTVALFRVNMEDLLFDGAFGETGTFNSDVIPDGTETRAFALTVAEGGKASRTIAVSLNITLDQDTETSIYHREGTHPNYHYVKVRDAELPATDIVNASFIAFDSGPVRDLQNAFIWVDHYGLGGSGHDGFVTGTTEGYSEYRLFLKKSQQMGKMGFVIINAQGDNDKRDNISIEFYGAGPAGDKEQKITLKAAYSTTSSTQGLNASGGGTQDGFISMVFRPTGAKKYKALVLEKNITIDAEGSAMQNQFIMTSSESPWYKLNVTRLIHATEGSMIIMRDYSKLTKCYATNEASLYCPITLGWPDANSAATMSRLHLYGGAITGNVVGKQAIHGKPPENANPAVFLHDKPLEEIVYGNTNQKGEPINSIGR